MALRREEKTISHFLSDEGQDEHNFYDEHNNFIVRASFLFCYLSSSSYHLTTSIKMKIPKFLYAYSVFMMKKDDKSKISQKEHA